MKDSERARKVINSLAQCSISVANDPSEENYQRCEREIEKAGKSSQDYRWLVVTIFLISLYMCTGVWMLGGNSNPQNDPQLINNYETSAQNESTLQTVESRDGQDKGQKSSSTAHSKLTRPQINCPGAPTQRVSIGDFAFVCTKNNNRLIVRKGPGTQFGEITRIYSGTKLQIIDGPKCANTYSWWKVFIDSSTIGWVAEGGDEIAPYFICPLK